MPDNEPHESRPIRRLTAVALLAIGTVLFLAVVVLSGIDRVAGVQPRTIAPLHWGLASGKSLALAHENLLNRDYEAARVAAMEAVRTAPLDAHAAAALAYASYMADHKKFAAAAFEVADRLGWRDNATQAYWFDRSIEVGDMQAAVNHLSAMLRTSPESPLRDRMFDQLSQYEEGRDALAAELRRSPKWARSFVLGIKDPTIESLDARADVVRRVGKGVWNCEEVSALVDNLRPAGLLDDALTVWRLNCPASRSLINDGEFNAIDRELHVVGLNWVVSRKGDVAISTLDQKDGTHALAINVAAAATSRVLLQPVILGPGRYRLIWRMPNTEDRYVDSLSTNLDCNQDLGSAEPGKALPGYAGAYFADFDVTDECPAQYVTFWAQPHNPVTIANVALIAIRPNDRSRHK